MYLLVSGIEVSLVSCGVDGLLLASLSTDVKRFLKDLVTMQLNVKNKLQIRQFM